MKEREDWRLTEVLHHEHGRGDPFAAAVRATRMAMIITDPSQPDNPIVFANEAFQHLSGYEREEILGRNCRFLQGPDTSPKTISRLRDAIANGEDVAVDILNYRKDGTTFWNALYMSPVRSDDGEIQFFFASQLDVTDRIEAQSRIAEQKETVEREVKRRTADLQASLEAQTLLLHEVDHRVKNNMTMIGSILRLQMREVEDEATIARLQAMMERIDALATVHRRLYQSDDVTRFDIGAFAINLATDIIHGAGRDDIGLKSDLRRAEVPAGQAAALGLVINEILTNAVRHGFSDGQDGAITVTARTTDGQILLTLEDDGVGFDPADRGLDGLGRILIQRLARQAAAIVEWRRLDPGMRITLSISVEAS